MLAPLTGRTRKDSAVRVSLSSYHNVKEPVGVQRKATLPNPRWKQIPRLESTTVGTSLEKTRVSSASVRKSRAVAYDPAGDASNPARLFDVRLGLQLVKGSA